VASIHILFCISFSTVGVCEFLGALYVCLLCKCDTSISLKVVQWCTNFPKIYEPHQGSGCQKGDMKLVLYRGLTDTRCHVPNLVAMVTWHLELVHPCCSQFFFWKYEALVKSRNFSCLCPLMQLYLSVERLLPLM
jgi:hypothetical protein